MDRAVAQRAGLEESRLVVEGRSAGRTAESRRGVALEAEQVHVAELQHVRIGPAVNRVAGLAAVDLYRSVLVDKGSLLFGVALEADRILGGRSHPHLIRKRRTVDVVAVAALNQPLVDTMMKWHLELRFLLQMAAIAELRLRLCQ